jgi:hypothetical protein
MIIKKKYRIFHLVRFLLERCLEAASCIELLLSAENLRVTQDVLEELLAEISLKPVQDF